MAFSSENDHKIISDLDCFHDQLCKTHILERRHLIKIYNILKVVLLYPLLGKIGSNFKSGSRTLELYLQRRT
jgi:hypothetical protein